MFSIKSTWEAIKLVSGSFMTPRHSFISWLAVFDRYGLQYLIDWLQGEGSLDGEDRVMISVYFVTVLQNVEITSFFLPCYDECMAGYSQLCKDRWEIGLWSFSWQNQVWKRNSSSLYHS